MNKKNSLQNEDSNLKNIKVPKKNNKTKNELIEELNSLKNIMSKKDDLIEKMMSDISNLKQEINAAKSLEMDNEELIAEMQLSMIKDTATSRPLTLEEARKYEIFSKIKNNINKDRNVIIDYSNLPENMSEKKLLDIAQKAIPDKDS